MLHFLVVALGGAIGASLRFGLCSVTQRPVGPLPSCDTLLVNALGALAIGLLAGGHGLPLWLRGGLVVGLLGGFTTFSAFSWDTVHLAGNTSTHHLLLHMLVNVLVPVLAAWGGYSLRSAIG